MLNCCGGSQVLRRTKGAMELVDVAELLPGLRRLPGMQRWKVLDRDRKAYYDSYAAAQQVRAQPCKSRGSPAAALQASWWSVST